MNQLPSDLTVRAQIARAAEIISSSDLLVVSAGAGMGVDSGLPDFRGRAGFWKAYPALAAANVDFYSIARPSTFVHRPELAWGFYGHRLALYRATVPHEGFSILERWAEKMALGYTVFTSNVDGQFQKAGYDPDRMHECHGSLHHLQCIEPCGSHIWSADGFAPDVDEATCLLRSDLPRCVECGQIARPNALLFGDDQWVDIRSAMQADRQDLLLSRAQRPVSVEIGAGEDIPSVRGFNAGLLRHPDSRLVRINPVSWRVGRAQDVGLPLGGLDALQRIDRFLAGEVR